MKGKGGNLISVEEAQSIILEHSTSFGVEEVSIDDSLGRILAQDIFSDRNYPPFNRSAMDGFAVRSLDIGKIKSFHIVGEVYAGQQSSLEVGEGQCMRIMTGAPLPKGSDAVIRVEDSELENNQVVFAVNEVRPWANVAREGEDTLNGSLILRKGILLKAPEVAVLAVTGNATVKVFKLPSVAIISTGDEVRPVGESILLFQIRDSNSYALIGLLKSIGISTFYRELVGDDKEQISLSLNKALKGDVVILSGGVSMGEADFVPEVLASFGVQKLLHKVSMKPGKPIWVGKTKEGKMIFALPGNPMSCQVTYKIFIEPWLRKSLGMSNWIDKIFIPLKEDRKKKTKLKEFFPCKYLKDNQLVLEEIKINGSGDITSTIGSEGLAIHPAESGDLKRGDYVEFIPWVGFYS